MKKISTIIILLLINYIVEAQTPQSIPYQAVARNIAGNLIANQSVSVRFTIHTASAAGTIVYKETQTALTNSLGLFAVNIGQGTPVTGTFSSISWGSGSKFMQVELDAAGGTNFVNMGTTQMMSVPYALYAENANVPGVAGPTGPQGIQGLTGAQGPNGLTGASGTNGKTLLNGTTAPSTGIGTVGDFYINTLTSQLYGPKTASSWGTPISLIGATGAQGPIGATGPIGLTGPAGADGTNGIDGTNGVDGTNGIDGINGLDGAPGPQGPQGIPGAGTVAGTLNYVGKFTPSGTEMGDSQIFDDGNNVGIGLSSGFIGKLDVASSDVITAISGESVLTNGTGLYGKCNIGTNAWGVYGESTTGYAGYFSGKVRITDKLGINALPTYPLNFENVVGDKISFFGSSGPHYGIGVQGGLLQLYTPVVGSDIAFGTGQSTAMTTNVTFKGNGNVGIGTTSPQEKLEVMGNLTSSGSLAGFRFADRSLGYANGWQWYSSGGSAHLFDHSNAVDRMVITNNGNVGIGTSLPTSPLQVAGNSSNPIAWFYGTGSGSAVLAQNTTFGGGSGAALEINGGIKVSGHKPAYVLTVSALNLISNGGANNIIDINDLTINNDPNAMLFLTPQSNYQYPLSAQYDSPSGHWRITSYYNSSSGSTPIPVFYVGEKINILIIKQ